MSRLPWTGRVGAQPARDTLRVGQLIAARACQGLGMGGVQALVQVATAAVIPPRERGRYNGYLGAVMASGSACRCRTSCSPYRTRSRSPTSAASSTVAFFRSLVQHIVRAAYGDATGHIFAISAMIAAAGVVAAGGRAGARAVRAGRGRTSAVGPKAFLPAHHLAYDRGPGRAREEAGRGGVQDPGRGPRCLICCHTP